MTPIKGYLRADPIPNHKTIFGQVLFECVEYGYQCVLYLLLISWRILIEINGQLCSKVLLLPDKINMKNSHYRNCPPSCKYHHRYVPNRNPQPQCMGCQRKHRRSSVQSTPNHQHKNTPSTKSHQNQSSNLRELVNNRLRQMQKIGVFSPIEQSTYEENKQNGIQNFCKSVDETNKIVEQLDAVIGEIRFTTNALKLQYNNTNIQPAKNRDVKQASIQCQILTSRNSYTSRQRKNSQSTILKKNVQVQRHFRNNPPLEQEELNTNRLNYRINESSGVVESVRKLRDSLLYY